MNENEILVGKVTPPPNVISPKIELADAIARGVDGFLILVGGAAVIAVIFAGILWASAAGDEEKIARAKKLLWAAIIGLFLAISAWGISKIFFEIFG